mgnify:CR=1 FL=1
MFTAEMLESIKKVEATREARLAKVLAGENPRRMTAEEKEQVLAAFHPDHIKSQFAELQIGPNKGERVPLELAEILQANSRIKPSDYVIAMTIPGRQWDSPGLSRHVDELMSRGNSSLVFLIGGSLGLSDKVIARADEEMSMSKMTFPHHLARVMFSEQIYRAFSIQAGGKYHN